MLRRQGVAMVTQEEYEANVRKHSEDHTKRNSKGELLIPENGCIVCSFITYAGVLFKELKYVRDQVDDCAKAVKRVKQERDAYQAVAVTIVEERLPPKKIGVVRLEAALDLVEALKESQMGKEAEK